MKINRTGLSAIIMFSVLLISASLNAQSQYKNLVFEGAGIRGLAYTGVIMELEDRGIISGIEKIGGTSAGAITALALSLGYTSEEIYDFISGTDFQQFNDGKYWFLGGFARMAKYYGWYRGEEVDKWLGLMLEAKTGKADITFKEMHDAGYKDIYITGTCLNRQKLIIFSAETYPGMQVKEAARISMSIPLYYEAVFIDENGKVYEEHDDKEGLYVMVDGGILGNFPIEIFDSYKIDSDGMRIRIPNMNTLGIRIDSEEQIKNDQQIKGLAPYEINDLANFVEAFYVLTLETINRRSLVPEDWQRTISVSSVGIGPRIKRLSVGQKDRLVNSGSLAAREFFTQE